MTNNTIPLEEIKKDKSLIQGRTGSADLLLKIEQVHDNNSTRKQQSSKRAADEEHTKTTKSTNWYPKRELLHFMSTLLRYTNIYFSFRNIILRKSADTRHEQKILLAFLSDKCEFIRSAWNSCVLRTSMMTTVNEKGMRSKLLFSKICVIVVRLSANSASKKTSQILEGGVGASTRAMLQGVHKPK